VILNRFNLSTPPVVTMNPSRFNHPNSVLLVPTFDKTTNYSPLAKSCRIGFELLPLAYLIYPKKMFYSCFIGYFFQIKFSLSIELSPVNDILSNFNLCILNLFNLFLALLFYAPTSFLTTTYFFIFFFPKIFRLFFLFFLLFIWGPENG